MLRNALISNDVLLPSRPLQSELPRVTVSSAYCLFQRMGGGVITFTEILLLGWGYWGGFYQLTVSLLLRGLLKMNFNLMTGIEI